MIGIIGIGKLGLCFLLHLRLHGCRVIGIDLNQEHILKLRTKKYSTAEPRVEQMLSSCEPTIFTSNIDEATQCETLFIFVNTPSLPDGSYDHSQVDCVLDQLKAMDYQGEIVVGCTVMPGYCDSKRKTHPNLRVSYNPQFIAMGSILDDLQNPDIVLIGEYDEQAGLAIKNIYDICFTHYPHRMRPKEAEIAKIALNCYITLKISFANMIGDACAKIGIDSQPILTCIGKDKRVGEKCLKYGYGYGGPCFPRDNRALAVFLNQEGIYSHLPMASDLSNNSHLKQQLELIQKNYLPEGVSTVSDGYRFESVAYKSKVHIIEESQKLLLAAMLAKEKTIIIADSAEIIDQVRQTYGDLFEYEVIDD